MTFLVDGDTYLHQEADPRYRGATIPSRAFRYLQNITDSGDITTAAGIVMYFHYSIFLMLTLFTRLFVYFTSSKSN